MTDATPALHHVGMSVLSLDAALAFWEAFLERPARFRGLLSRPYLGQSVGYPGVEIDAALIDLPGGGLLELLEYRVAERRANPEATANPGNVHLCLAVPDAGAAWGRAVAAGAQPVNPAGPVEVNAGPNRGARAAYLRVHDGISLELFQPPAGVVSDERRYERLSPDRLAALLAEAPVAFAPLGPMEFHGPHLPVGVNAFAAHGLCLRAAAHGGGVVLPTSYLASGCLDLPFTLDFSPDLVHGWARATLAQLARRGYRVVVLLTGHGPLDLNHLLKRACAEAEAAHPGLRAYGLCWLELNAARMRAPDEGEPTVVNHAALVETSWMLHLVPELVDLDRLAPDPEAVHTGVYGRNPRFTASRGFGAAQVEAAAELLGDRVRTLLEGGGLDPLADLRRFVELSWPEPLEVAGLSGGASEAALLISNPGRASRYLSGLALRIDGEALDASGITLVNASAGEVGAPVPAATLGPERGFYIRRGQVATAALGIPIAEGDHAVELDLGLGGVIRATIAATTRFEPPRR